MASLPSGGGAKRESKMSLEGLRALDEKLVAEIAALDKKLADAQAEVKFVAE